jgi:hypothetical protein
MRGWSTRTAIVLAGLSSGGCSSSSGPPGPSPETTPAFMRDSGGDAPAASVEASTPNDAMAADETFADSANDTVLDGAPTDAIATDSQGVVVSDGGPAADAGPPLCDPAHVWKATRLLASLPQANFGRFGGISADETVIAWTSPAGVIYVGDRPLRSQAFSATPSTVNTTPTPVANDRVALGSTGMDLVAVAADRKSFAAFYRSSIGAAWAPAAALQFININALVTAEGGQFSEPVLGANDASFFYLLTPTNAAPVLFESTWDTTQHVWTNGTPLPNAEFAIQSTTSRRRATGASADGRTLFFYDEVAGSERAAWRESSASPFVQFVDVAGMTEAAPNYRCDTLYFQGRGSDSGASAAAIAQ